MSTKRKTTEQFIEEARKIHGDKYDYSKVEYINQVTAVCIICPIHGEFKQIPKLHLRGSGCPKCGVEQQSEKRRNKPTVFKKERVIREKRQKFHVPLIKTTEEFINRAKEIHGDKYDYSKVVYKGKKEHVTIICPEHGEFQQRANFHLNGGGCPKCGRMAAHEKQRYTNDEFIENLKKIYGDRYDYSKVEYKGRKEKITLICKKHGEFEKIASDLINKRTGCQLCNKENKRKLFSLGKENFIEKSNNIFHGKYSYENVIYVNNSTKVNITCPKHGDFPCTPANHLKGRGCPICKAENNVYEERLYNFLLTIFDKNEIKWQYKPKWLSDNKSLDFFIEKYNIAIEHQGSQHFKYVPFLCGNKSDKFERTIHNDINKKYECEANDVKLLYFTYELNNVDIYFDTVYTKEEDLKNKILDIIKKEK